MQLQSHIYSVLFMSTVLEARGMAEECQGPCDSYVKVCTTVRTYTTVTQWWRPDCVHFCFVVLFRLACAQTVILVTGRRLRWFLTAGTPSSYKPFTCKHSIHFYNYLIYQKCGTPFQYLLKMNN